MRLRTRIRDCLYLNWAIPASWLPPPPSPLRYEIHRDGEIDYALAVLDGRVDLDVFDAALQSFVELADEHGFQPVVSYSPSAHTVYKESIVFEEPDVEAPLAQYSQALRNYLTRAADEFGFLFVDATAAMQAAADGSRRADLLYFPTNLHFTPAGHRLLAEQIAEALAETPGRS